MTNKQSTDLKAPDNVSPIMALFQYLSSAASILLSRALILCYWWVSWRCEENILLLKK